MARPLFTAKEVVGKIPKDAVITGSASLKGLLTLRLKSVPSEQIMAGFERAINRASKRIAQDLQVALDAALRSKVWSTRGGSDDIFDTGELLESGTVAVTSTGLTISYSAPYAALVHYGGYINPYGNKSAKVYLPPRPWIDAVLNGGGPVAQFDFVSYYKKEIESEFSA